MIRFACRCGHVFEEPDDSAGGAVQCPRCMLLNDIPMQSDLLAMNPDGTYRVDPAQAARDPNHASDFVLAFAKTKVDADGESIDLRNTADEMDDVGQYDTMEGARRRALPRYDPETGERIVAIPLAGDGDIAAPPLNPATIPIAKPAIAYAMIGTIKPRTIGHAIVDLLKPLSLLVIGFVLGLHLLMAAVGVLVSLQLYFFLPVVALFAWAILAHYGNVTAEIGIEQRDELPRVLGDFRMREDIFLPAFHLIIALLICYGPAACAFVMLVPVSLVAASIVAAIVAIVGTPFLPAIMLTLLTSGSVANLRPDRVLSVMRIGGRRYRSIVLATFIGLLPYAWGLFSLYIEGLRVGLVPVSIPTWATQLPVAIALVLFGIIAAHLVMWEIGLMYRYFADEYPWVGRYHDRKAPPVPRRKPRYVAPPVES